jgi:uncharacterized membrane protein YdjX (TVP38/TMEM64 family)
LSDILPFAEYLIDTFGYLGIFIVEAIANATLFFPIPGAIFTMASGLFLNPIMVGIYAGLGAAVGELTGYLVGFGGGVLIEDKVEFKSMRRVYAKYGLWTIYIFSAIPFPFDIIGIICGVLRVRPLAFFVLTALGKITSRVMLAAVGTQVANIFIGILEGRFDLLAIILILIISAIFTFSISYWKIIVNRDKKASNSEK